MTAPDARLTTTDPTPPRRSPRGTLARGRTRLRATHPTTLLRWLRAGVLATVAATALLYLVVSTKAEEQLSAARNTDEAISDIRTAHGAAENAAEALTAAFDTGQVSLIGTGTEFANQTASVYTNVTSAAEGNAAGERGLTQFQFVLGQLTTCLQLADAAVRDYPRTGAKGMEAAHAALTDRPQVDPDTTPGAIPGTGGLTASLDDLTATQQEALTRQLDSAWLDPAHVYPLLVGPSAVMLLLVLATGHVVARHFRRYVGPGLPIALLATASVGAATAVRGTRDAQQGLERTPLAGHPLTMTLALALLAAAAVLAYLAYRPRLAEYRFPRS
ncbi:hypothetical protein [Streptomyces sp. NPDC006638]|uniref:hypothetical protein n=1 Tax=Streptomyces sp. NPDC006638 TaxID=3157183 RepID=UPI00339F578C